VNDRGEFGVEETVGPDGWTHLRLLGELDQATARTFSQRLDELKRSGASVRLDLSALDFIDSSGVRSVLLSLQDARRERWQLEVQPEVSWQVDRVIKVLGIAPVLWPPVTETS
jgi:anti-anti-sigma factor